jgi:hypothetical protein
MSEGETPRTGEGPAPKTGGSRKAMTVLIVVFVLLGLLVSLNMN